ncbi:MAG: hypothetical protein J5525_12740 [Lachnospiraceae bacterium]|nr:hypothetical protein [Lachnospiraceae bacterium]
MNYRSNKPKGQMLILNENLDYLDRMKNVINLMLEGVPEIKACSEFNINVNDFRKFMEKEKPGFSQTLVKEVFEDPERRESISYNILSWEEKLYCDIFNFKPKDIINIPVDADESIHYAIEQLKPGWRRIVRMRYEESMSINEIANELKVAPEVVRQYHFKILRRLRKDDITKVLYGGMEFYKESIKYRKVINERKCSDAVSRMKKRIERAINNNDINALLRLNKDISIALTSSIEKQQVPVIEESDEPVQFIKASGVSIDVADFSARTYNLLKRRGIDTFDAINGITTSELSSIRGMGKSSLQEIIDKSEKYGYAIITDR